jgi:hypothetical protein
VKRVIIKKWRERQIEREREGGRQSEGEREGEREREMKNESEKRCRWERVKSGKIGF